MRKTRMIRLTLPTALLLTLSALPASAEPQQPPPDQAPAAEGERRVVFIPESVKAQLREEIRKEVLEQAKAEGWFAPHVLPEWLQRFKLSGDVRARFERDLFGRGNANSGEFPDFNAINTNKPFDVNFVDPSNERYLDVDQNRTRPRLRARLGVGADIGQGFSAGVQVASGEGANPGSANQTLGASGGDFSKYQLWIDRAFLQYAAAGDDELALSVKLGRFENPFFTSEMLWAPDVNLDGAVFVGSRRAGSFRPFLAVGAFPIYTTTLAFPAERTDKFPSTNKWLYAVQAGTEWKPRADVEVKLAFAFYDFDKVEGRAAGDCDTNLSYVTCRGDDTRPSFAQKGNTYLALRYPSAAALSLEASSLVPRYQFFGLASRFRELVAGGRLGYLIAPRLLAAAEAEFVHNAGFNKGQVAALALNNRGSLSPGDQVGAYLGGRDGFQGRLSIGSDSQAHRWDWKFRLAYRYLQSDAVLDAVNDQDFGLGGTNLKGFALEGTLWVADNIGFNPRWYSADQIVGPKYSVDVLQLDLLARF